MISIGCGLVSVQKLCDWVLLTAIEGHAAGNLKGTGPDGGKLSIARIDRDSHFSVKNKPTLSQPMFSKEDPGPTTPETISYFISLVLSLISY